MQKVIFYVSALILLLGTPLFAETIYVCKVDKSTAIGWQYGGMFTKKGLDASAENSPNQPIAISLVVKNEKGILRGNSGQVDLQKISSNTFIERTPTGNLFMWTVFEGSKDIPTYVFQQKAYELAGPLAVTVAYKCN